MIYTSFADTLFFFYLGIFINALVAFLIAPHYERKSIKRDMDSIDRDVEMTKKFMLNRELDKFKKVLEDIMEDDEDCDCGNCHSEVKKEEVKKEPVKKPRVKAGDIVTKKK